MSPVVKPLTREQAYRHWLVRFRREVDEADDTRTAYPLAVGVLQESLRELRQQISRDQLDRAALRAQLDAADAIGAALSQATSEFLAMCVARRTASVDDGDEGAVCP